MKTFTLRLKECITTRFLKGCLCAIVLCTTFSANAQVRKYATRQFTDNSLLAIGSFSNTANAVDVSPLSSSNITMALGALDAWREQIIDFNPSSSSVNGYATMIPGSTPITVKLTLPAGLLSALGGIEIQAVKNLNHTTGIFNAVGYDNVGALYSGASLLSLISGTGEIELTITPGADYQGLRVRLKSGVASVGFGVDIFSVYIKETATAAITCDERIDRLSGVTSNVLANLASGLGSVQDPGDAMDGSTSTYAQLNMGAQVLNATYLTTILKNKSKVNDSVRVVLRDNIATIINLGLLNALTIKLYNGPTQVKTITNVSSLLSLYLLAPASDKYVLSAEVDQEFDRIQLEYGGVASLLNSLRIYEVERKVGSPLRTAAQRNIYAYAGQSATLSSTPATGDVVTWYDNANGGNLVGTSILTTAAQANTVVPFYAQVTRSGCSDNIDRARANVNVVGVTYGTPGAGTINIVYSGNVTATPGSALPVTPSYTYTITSGTLPAGLSLSNATGVISGTPNTPGNYTFDVTTFDVANNLPVSVRTYTITIGGGIPDLTPIISMPNPGFIIPGNLTRAANLKIYNIAEGTTTTGTITVYVYPPTPNFSLALTGLAVANWTATYNAPGNYYTLTSTTPIPFGLSSFASIDMNLTAGSNVIKGGYNFVYQVATGAGSEVNDQNNTQSLNVSVSN